VEPLSLPGITRHINKLLCKAAQKWGSGLAIHNTSGFNWDWLKVVIFEEFVVFLAFALLQRKPLLLQLYIKHLCIRFKVLKNYGMVHICILIIFILLFQTLAGIFVKYFI